MDNKKDSKGMLDTFINISAVMFWFIFLATVYVNMFALPFHSPTPGV